MALGLDFFLDSDLVFFLSRWEDPLVVPEGAFLALLSLAFFSFFYNFETPLLSELLSSDRGLFGALRWDPFDFRVGSFLLAGDFLGEKMVSFSLPTSIVTQVMASILSKNWSVMAYPWPDKLVTLAFQSPFLKLLVARFPMCFVKPRWSGTISRSRSRSLSPRDYS